MFLQFRARDILNEAVSNCVAEDPVKRMVQSVHYVRLFAPNCPTKTAQPLSFHKMVRNNRYIFSSHCVASS